MPKRSKVSQLPKAVQDWIEQALVDGNFSGYELLAAELKARGYDISKSTLQRAGSKIERRLERIRATTDAAKLITAQVGDDEDAKSEALIAITQHELFEALNNLQEAATSDDAEGRVVLLSKATKGIAEIVRASISRKKFAAGVRKEALSEAAKAAELAAKASGISDAASDAIVARILGLPA